MTTYMTAQEIHELKRLCADPMIELRMALRPKHLKCFQPHIANSSVVLVINFPKHEGSEFWNKIHEKRILRSGHMATVALTILVGLAGGGTLRSIATGSTAAIVKDEIQAKIWYPKVFAGWSLIRTYFFNYQQFPSQNFTMRWTDTIRDENGNEREKRGHDMFRLEVGGPFGVPETVVEKIMTRYPQYRQITFEAVE